MMAQTTTGCHSQLSSSSAAAGAAAGVAQGGALGGGARHQRVAVAGHMAAVMCVVRGGYKVVGVGATECI